MLKLSDAGVENGWIEREEKLCRSQSMQSGSKPRTRLRSTFGEFGDDWGMFV